MASPARSPGSADGELRSAVENFLTSVGINESAHLYVDLLRYHANGHAVSRTSLQNALRVLRECTADPQRVDDAFTAAAAQGGEALERFTVLLGKIAADSTVRTALAHGGPGNMPIAAGATPSPPQGEPVRPAPPSSGASVGAGAPERAGSAQGAREAPTPTSPPPRNARASGEAWRTPPRSARILANDTSSADTPLTKSFLKQMWDLGGEGGASNDSAADGAAVGAAASASGGRAGEPKTSSATLLPRWAAARPHLRGEIEPTKGAGKDGGLSLDSCPVPLQELLLIEDVLFVLDGVEGRYVRLRADGAGQRRSVGGSGPLAPRFTIDPHLDLSLRELAGRIVPVCEDFAAVRAYAESTGALYTAGTVAHALSAALRDYVREVLVLVAQLEHEFRAERLTLAKMWFYLQPAARTLRALGAAVRAAGSKRGGALLNALLECRAANAGDAPFARALDELLERASAPLLEMLDRWLSVGSIQDRYGEFFVRENDERRRESIQEDFNSSYWEERYTIVPEQVPVFLRELANQILQTGKYINVSQSHLAKRKRQQHGDKDTASRTGAEKVSSADDAGDTLSQGEADGDAPRALSTERAPLRFSRHEKDYVAAVDAANRSAAAQLLGILRHDCRLLEHLRSAKRFFLLSHGDFLVHFMDTAEAELQRPVGEVQRAKLDSLLQLALASSTAATDPFRDDLSCALVTKTIFRQLLDIVNVHEAQQGANASASRTTGMEGFTFSLAVEWPLSLVLSRNSLTKYQLLFRHLFHCKNVERQLCKAFADHQSLKELSLDGALAPSYTLRQRMLHFLQSLLHYMMFEVIEPGWHELEEKLAAVSTIDEVLELHNSFLDSTIGKCMLRSPVILKILTKLMSTCVIFANYTERFCRAAGVDHVAAAPQPSRRKRHGPSQEDRRERLKIASEHVTRVMADKNYASMIDRFVTNFDALVRQLIEAVRYYAAGDPHISHLVTRLDFNGFYAVRVDAPAP